MCLTLLILTEPRNSAVSSTLTDGLQSHGSVKNSDQQSWQPPTEAISTFPKSSCLPASLLSLSHQRPLCRLSTLIQDSSNLEWVVDPPHAAAHQWGAPLPAQSPGSYVIADTECASIARTGLLQASTNLNTISEVFLFEKTVLQFNPYSVNLFWGFWGRTGLVVRRH